MIIIPGIYNAQTNVPGGSVQGQTISVGAILKVTERDRRPYPTDPGTPSEIWIDNTAAIGYICKEVRATGTVWDRLDVLGDYIAFGDGDPGSNIDITLGYRPGSLRYARSTQTLWICDNNTQGAAVWSALGSGGTTISLKTNGSPNLEQSVLNLVEGANMVITADALGNVTFDSTGGGLLSALPYTTDHISAFGNGYLVNDLVWYNGDVYRCIASNDSILPTDINYWVNLGPGYQLVQQPSDWNSTSGNNQILNKPTIPTSIVESITATLPITSTGGTTPDISTSMNTNKLIGRGTAGTGPMEEITLGTGLSFTGTTLNASSTSDSISPFLLMGG